MTRDEHLMTVGAEECVEVAQACLALAQRIQKAQRFGMQQIQQDADDQPQQNPERLTNFERIRREYVDLVAAMDMMGVTLSMVLDDEVEAKRNKVERYLQRSATCGTLTSDRLMADAWYLGRKSTQTIPTSEATGPKLQEMCAADLDHLLASFSGETNPSHKEPK